MLNVHVLTTGAHIYEVYLKIASHYPIREIVLIHEQSAPGSQIHENDEHKKIVNSIDLVNTDCKNRQIPCDILEYKNGDLEDLVVKILALRKRFPKTEWDIHFNITAGKKDTAIMAFMGGLWIDAVGYYFTKEMKKPLEFPIPKMSDTMLQNNKLFQKILEILSKSSPLEINQSAIRNRIKVNPNKPQKDLSPQVLSQAIATLADNGLIQKDPQGRDTLLKITLAGRMARSMIVEK